MEESPPHPLAAVAGWGKVCIAMGILTPVSLIVQMISLRDFDSFKYWLLAELLQGYLTVRIGTWILKRDPSALPRASLCLSFLIPTSAGYLHFYVPGLHITSLSQLPKPCIALPNVLFQVPLTLFCIALLVLIVTKRHRFPEAKTCLKAATIGLVLGVLLQGVWRVLESNPWRSGMS